MTISSIVILSTIEQTKKPDSSGFFYLSAGLGISLGVLVLQPVSPNTLGASEAC
jgi:hypothetical protein